MDDKPWTTVLKEQLGYLSYLTWPYRAALWYRERSDAPPKPTAKKTPPPLKKTAPQLKKVVQPKPRTSSRAFVFKGSHVALAGAAAIAVFFLVGGLIMSQHDNPGIYVIPFIATVSAIAHFFKNLRYTPKDERPRDPNGLPPTLEEQKQAYNQLRLAQSHYEEAFKAKTPYEQQAHFVRASKAVNRVRALDPHAVLELQDKEGTYSQTIDQMAAKLLYSESTLYYTQAKAMSEAVNAAILDGGTDSADRKRAYARTEAKIKEAIEPAEKAARYEPNNSFYLVHLCKVYVMAGHSRKARPVCKHLDKIDPDNIEVIRLKETLRL